MKYPKLILTIIKNLFLILVEAVRDLIVKIGIKKFAAVVILVLVLGFGGYKMWQYFRPDPNDSNLSLAQAAKIGEVTTHKLMVMIEKRNCPSEIASGCYERGDIVLIKPADFEFSDGEKESFLILNMDITDKQAEVLVRSLEQKAKVQPKEKSPDGRPQMEQLKIRKYAVDLKKIGIGDDVTSGKEAGEIYKWDVVKEKQ
ncbi:MAG TPA: hypothetical protein VK255_01380 [Patescibacteria group bacterium]|nr:hypothetical protein [Patescibacteria group bacterium]